MFTVFNPVTGKISYFAYYDMQDNSVMAVAVFGDTGLPYEAPVAPRHVPVDPSDLPF
jgi:hypothetical protein